MQMEEARGFVFQALRRAEWNNEFQRLLNSVGMIVATAQSRNVDEITQRHGYWGGLQVLAEQEKALIVNVVWSLVIQGILVPGSSDGKYGWPNLHLTEYGKQCIEEDRVLPHDPDGFLQDFHRELPNADSTVVEYLTESLQCFIHGLHRSAAVMLGGASEQAVLLLIDSCTDAIADRNAKQTFQSKIEKALSIFRKYEVFDQRFSGLKRRMPRELTDNVDSQMRGVFDLIRGSRNDAGHPAIGASVGRDAVYSHLRLFTPYCRRIHELIAWFASNST